jgi:hypothetical protein
VSLGIAGHHFSGQRSSVGVDIDWQVVSHNCLQLRNVVLVFWLKALFRDPQVTWLIYKSGFDL